MFKGLAREIADALFPESFTCELCGAETFNARLCPDCDSTVFYNDGISCPVCGRRCERAEVCYDCKQRAPSFERGVSALVYEGGAIALIAAYKRGKPYLKNFFADLLHPFVKTLPPYDAIVYIPMTDAAKKARGYNQSELLAKAIAEREGKEVLPLLEKIAETPQQKTLTRSERENNLKSCFKVTDKSLCAGKNLLVVDDVLTTGATANAAAEKLKAAKAKNIYVATAASVEYKPLPPINFDKNL